MLSLTFRKVTAQDIPLLNRLLRAAKGHWKYPEERLNVFMTQCGIADETYFDHVFGFVAEQGQDEVGGYLFNTSEATPELDHFFLDPHFMGQGNGRCLWEHCVDQARQKGWDHFIFWADPHTLGFYEHMGAVTIGERPMVTLPSHMAPVMQYRIKSPF